MPAGAPNGNNNARKGSEWRDAIRAELAEIGRDREGDQAAYIKGLRECAKQFIEAAKTGESWALKELGDRMDGKAAQSLTLSGDSENPLSLSIPVEYVNSPASRKTSASD